MNRPSTAIARLFRADVRLRAWRWPVLAFFLLFTAGGVAHDFVHTGESLEHRCDFGQAAAEPALAAAPALPAVGWLASALDPTPAEKAPPEPEAPAPRGRAPPRAA